MLRVRDYTLDRITLVSDARFRLKSLDIKELMDVGNCSMRNETKKSEGSSLARSRSV